LNQVASRRILSDPWSEFDEKGVSQDMAYSHFSPHLSQTTMTVKLDLIWLKEARDGF